MQGDAIIVVRQLGILELVAVVLLLLSTVRPTEVQWSASRAESELPLYIRDNTIASPPIAVLNSPCCQQFCAWTHHEIYNGKRNKWKSEQRYFLYSILNRKTIAHWYGENTMKWNLYNHNVYIVDDMQLCFALLQKKLNDWKMWHFIRIFLQFLIWDYFSNAKSQTTMNSFYMKFLIPHTHIF